MDTVILIVASALVVFIVVKIIFRTRKNKYLHPIHVEGSDTLVYEMHNKDANFKTLFGSLGKDLKSLAFESQEQIEKIAQENKQLLRTNSSRTFFLFAKTVDGQEDFFVAGVLFSSSELLMSVNHLSSARVWSASHARRVVVPT